MRTVLNGRRLSPGLVISMIALFVAISGVAGALPGQNSVDTGDLKPNSVRSSDIKANNVKGSDVTESTLGTVPNAANATNATNAGNANNANTVGGNSVVAFSLVGAAPIANTQILNLNGLQLLASCAGGAVTITAQTTINDGEISTFSHDASGSTEADDFDDAFNVGDNFTVSQATPSDEVGQGRYIAGDSAQFVHFTYTQEDATGANNCLLHGFATGN